MSEFNVEPKPKDIEGIRALVGRVLSLDIRCIEMTAKIIDQSGLVPTVVEIHIDPNIDYLIESNRLVGKYRASVELKSNEVLVAMAKTEYALIHNLNEGEKPTDTELQGYLSSNGLFIVYPYLRESLQASIARIGMGNLVLGILRRDQLLTLDMNIQIGPTPVGD